jgi:succinate-acetate transporter protein
MFCLFFGAGCQFLAGMMNFANRNLYGGTLLTAFSFNWAMNWWALDSLAKGAVPDHTIILATEIVSLVLFAVFTYGFGFFSKLLFVFLLDIDAMFVSKLLNAATRSHAFDPVIAVTTVLLGLIALWIAFAILINPTAGRPIFAMPGPLFFAPKKAAAPAVDLGPRQAIADALYTHWRGRGFAPMPIDELTAAVAATLAAPRDLRPELDYMDEHGGVALTRVDGVASAPVTARLTAAGIDVYEEHALGA